MGILTLAFSADPMARWSFPEPATYLEVFASLAKAFGGSAFKANAAYVTDGFTGAALWLPPGATSDEKSLKLLFEEG